MLKLLFSGVLELFVVCLAVTRYIVKQVERVFQMRTEPNLCVRMWMRFVVNIVLEIEALTL